MTTQPDRPWERDDASAAKAAEEKKYGRYGCFGVIAFVVLVTGLGFLADDDEEPTVGRYEAQAACQEFVERRLKAPATADFSEWFASPIGDLQWSASGSVDAENSFGAKVRSKFRCTMRDTGERFVLISLTGLGPVTGS